MASKIAGGDCAAHIIAVHGRDASKHVLELAWALIEAASQADPEEIGRLARLMREIEANQRRQIDRVAELYAA